MTVFDFDSAIVRTPAASVVHGLRMGDHDGPTHDGVLAEFHAYVAALARAGLAVEMLPALEAYPDSAFVEDPAFVLPEGAIVLRPGAATRIGESAELAPVLHRRFARVLVQDEGFADGGDILILPGEILIGLSGRTDRAGAERFVALAADLGRSARIVAAPPGVLHLKTA
ncbi:MAG: dimethylarginine dimethylaminohydrolase, partial [Allosphingosinicella sp.]